MVLASCRLPWSCRPTPRHRTVDAADFVAFGPDDAARAHRGCYASFVWIFAEEQVRGFVVAAAWADAVGSCLDQSHGQLVVRFAGAYPCRGHGVAPCVVDLPLRIGHGRRSSWPLALAPIPRRDGSSSLRICRVVVRLEPTADGCSGCTRRRPRSCSSGVPLFGKAERHADHCGCVFDAAPPNSCSAACWQRRSSRR